MDQDFSYHRRWLLRNTVEALEDVATILASMAGESDSACQFITAYEHLTQASPEGRRKIFDDPRTAIWIESVETAILASDNSIPSESDIAAWSTYISILALSATLMDGVAYQTKLLQPQRGFSSLPGMGSYFILPERLDTISLSTTSDGALYVNGENVALCSIPEWGGFQLATSDLLLTPPDSTGIARLNDSDVAHQNWPDCLERASKLIALHPPSLELSRSFAPIIVPVQAEAENTHCSVSFSTRPCVLYMSWAPLVHIIAEAIVHESDHQLFYLLTRHADFWEESVENQPSIFRSPWRNDPRPLDGLLRGASAFIRVGEFWDAIRQTFESGSEDFDWTGRRTVLAVRQSVDAISVLKRYGSLSFQGHDLVVSLEDRARSLLDNLSKESAFDSWRKIAIESEIEHDTAWRERQLTDENDWVNHE